MTANATSLPIAGRIQKARVEAGLTVAELARRLGVDPRTVAGWQAGRSRPSYARLLALAEILNKSPSYFLDAGTEA